MRYNIGMSAGEITSLLNAAQMSDQAQLDRIYQLLYQQIKRIAANQLKQVYNNETLSPTVLANECYIKLSNQIQLNHHDRKHFLNYLAKSMRRFILDHIRDKNRQKRKAQLDNRHLSQLVGINGVPFDLYEIDGCIDQLSQVDTALSDLFQQKLLFEFTFKELADIHGISERQVIRRWNHAKSLVLTLLEHRSGIE